jgi:glycine dehydrogenase subunit 1
LTNSRLSPAFEQPTFKEFVARDREGRVADLLAQASDAGYLAGLPLGAWYPQLTDCFLVTVTEKRTKAEIDGLAEVLSARRETALPRPHVQRAGANV